MSGETRYPYPGLRAFTREESDLFFGRDGCVDRMVDRLSATRFLAVLGPSGGGKSSLVRTGLLDALDLGLASAAGSRWRIAHMHPGGAPMRNLATALLKTRDDKTPEAQEVDYLVPFLHRGPRAVSEWAGGGNLPDGWNLLILVDQFEELFRYGDYAESEEAEEFVAMLLESASAANPRLHVVLTMRSEYLGACSLLPGLAERVNDGIYLTPRMNREECRDAIEGPARVMGFEVEPALVTRLLNDLASFAPWDTDPCARQGDQLARRADQLPLMQHVLNRLWIRSVAEASGELVELKLADYDACGGLTGAIDHHADEVMESLGKGARRGVEAVFRALISGTSVATATRRPSKLADLTAVVGSRRDAIAIIEAFSGPGCNFLHLSHPTLDDAVIIDISHESLIRQWTLLRGWLEEEARDGAEWARLTAARERHEAGKEELLSGLSLHSLDAWFEEAKPTAEWAARHGGGFDEARAFLDRSREAEGLRTHAEQRRDRREKNLLRATAGALVGLMLMMGTVILIKLRADNASDRDMLAVLKQVGNTLQTDQYVSLLGFGSFQSRLAHLIDERLGTLHADSIMKGPEKVRSLYRLAISVDEAGDPIDAIEHYKNGYELGCQLMEKSGPRGPLSDEDKIIIFQNAGRYAWRLFDTGKRDEAMAVIKRMRQWTRVAHESSDDWSAAEALVLALESRALRDDNKQDKALEKLHQAAPKVAHITAYATSSQKRRLQGPTMDQIRLAYWVHLGLLRATHEQAEREIVRTLGKAMFGKNQMDRRAIGAYVSSLVSDATRAPSSDEALADAEEAKEKIAAGLTLSNDDRSLHLLNAQVETTLASLDDRAEAVEHLAEAEAALVRALQTNYILTCPAQVQELYNNIKTSDLESGTPKTTEALARDIEFYRGVYGATEGVLKAYPDSPIFNAIAKDAIRRLEELQKAKAPVAIPAAALRSRR